jgi:hypothetical protein
VTIFSLDAIEDIYGSDPKMADLRAEAEAELAADQSLWNAADENIGYVAAKREEEEAGDSEQGLVDALISTRATSLAGIAGKLDVILHEGESWEECTQFPWPHIRSALCDLVRIGQTVELDVVMPGERPPSPFTRQASRGLLVSTVEPGRPQSTLARNPWTRSRTAIVMSSGVEGASLPLRTIVAMPCTNDLQASVAADACAGNIPVTRSARIP